MVESSVGDDTLLICPSCGYAANEEKGGLRTRQGARFGFCN
ncbi:hypothetical protein [Treponema sp. OMZ 788]